MLKVKHVQSVSIKKDPKMQVKNIPARAKGAEQFNVIIEIPAHSPGVKYEVDKDSGALLVDRFMSTTLSYPCHYGFIPNTLAQDGDPFDVLVCTSYPLMPGSVIACRVIGMLEMTDEAGVDHKALAVPASSVSKEYDDIHNYDDLPPLMLKQIKHFFEHYKDLEEGKWVKLEKFVGKEQALESIQSSVLNSSDS